MGILSALGKIGAIGAAPFTGGASLGALPLIDAIGSVGSSLGAGASASKAGRMADADLQARMDALNNRSGLDAAEFNMGVPVTQAQQVAKGDLMAANIPQSAATGSGRDISFSGGIGPQFFGTDTTQAGEALKRQALGSLMSGGGKFTPKTSTIPEAGMMEKIGGVGGLVGGLAGATGNVLGALGRTPVMYGQTGRPTGAPNLGYQPLRRASLLEDPNAVNGGV